MSIPVFLISNSVFAGNLMLNTSGGNVGIGTATPGSALEIKTSAATDTNLLKIGDNTKSAYITSGSGYFGVATNDAVNRFYISQSTGNIGIGTSSSSYKLDVNGTMHVSGNVVVDGAFTFGSVSVPWSSVAGVPTKVSSFTNDSGYLVSSGTIANSTNSANSYQTTNPSAGTYRILLGNGTNENSQVYNKSGLYWNDSGSIIQGANISGNASTATVAANLSGGGGAYIQRTSSGTAYSNAIQIRETAGSTGSNVINAPLLGFHWAGVVASSIRLDSDGVFSFVNNPGNAYESIRANNITGAAFLYSSDKTLKKDIKKLDNSLNKVLSLQGVSFKWKDESKNNKINIGLIAQDVEKVYPEIVVTGIDGKKSVEYGNLVAPLIESIKEQQRQIEDLKNEIRLLKAGK